MPLKLGALLKQPYRSSSFIQSAPRFWGNVHPRILEIWVDTAWPLHPASHEVGYSVPLLDASLSYPPQDILVTNSAFVCRGALVEMSCDLAALQKCFIIRKKKTSRPQIVLPAILGPEMAAPIFMGASNFCVLSAGKPLNSSF